MQPESRATHNDSAHISKKRKRRVAFSGNEEVISMKKPTNEDLRNAWYRPCDLEVMRKDVKVQAKRYRNALTKTISSSSVSAHMSSLVLPFANSGVEKKMRLLSGINSATSNQRSNPSTTFRGLEPRIFVEKQRNRIIAMKTTLEYQRRSQKLLSVAQAEHHPKHDIDVMKEGFAQRLGDICSQLSMWAKDEAQAAAKYDVDGLYEVPSTVARDGQWQGQDQRQNPSSQNKNVDISMPSLKERPMNIPINPPQLPSSPPSSVSSACSALKRKRQPNSKSHLSAHLSFTKHN